MEAYFPQYIDAIDVLVSKRSNINPQRIKSLKFAAKKGNLRIFPGFSDKPIGFVSWARVNKDSILLYLDQKRLPTYFWEYDEGNITFIQDVVFKDKWVYQARKNFVEFLRSKKVIFYVRNDRACLLVRKGGYFKRTIFHLA